MHESPRTKIPTVGDVMLRRTLPIAAIVTPRLFARVAQNEESRVAHEEDSRVTADASQIFNRIAFDSSQIFSSCGLRSSIHNRRHQQHNAMQHYRRTIRIVQPATSRSVGGVGRSLNLIPEFVFRPRW
jgi:hypothetical protein